MASAFGWLDTDSEQRRRMLEVVEMFREAGTVDELGTGSIRDALANALFPGTSVLHGRLRYVLFIPWLLERAAHKEAAAEMATEFRRLEIRLIQSLEAGGETAYVIGIEARNAIRRTAAIAHWSALSRWGILERSDSLDRFFRRQVDLRALARRSVVTEEASAHELLPGTGIDQHLPTRPDGLLSTVDFALAPTEEQYLSDRIATSTDGSMMAWLVHHPPGYSTDHVWQLDNLGSAPGRLAELVDHARRFHTVIFGAVLLYNLLVAEASDQDDRVAGYGEQLVSWEQELQASRVLDGWNRTSWWSTIRQQNPSLNPRTIDFVDRWCDLIRNHSGVASNRTARLLIRNRERHIKGRRARLANQAALDRWSGGSGLIRLDYRWSIAQRHLTDLYNARESS